MLTTCGLLIALNRNTSLKYALKYDCSGECNKKFGLGLQCFMEMCEVQRCQHF
jgi:hypothetical protein